VLQAIKKSLQRRANHLPMAIVGKISSRPCNGRGLFLSDLFSIKRLAHAVS